MLQREKRSHIIAGTMEIEDGAIARWLDPLTLTRGDSAEVFVETKVPQSDVPGEKASPTQPIPMPLAVSRWSARARSSS